MMTFNDRHCSMEPELDQEYVYNTYTTTANGRDVIPSEMKASGAEWIDAFLHDMREWGDTDVSEEIIADWQRKFDNIGLAYNCATRELDIDKLVLDRATKYINQ